MEGENNKTTSGLLFGITAVNKSKMKRRLHLGIKAKQENEELNNSNKI